ncbi:MAG: hypothetical protein VKP72_10975 [bacterium]|nr:hypothetical protein [bacterium]
MIPRWSQAACLALLFVTACESSYGSLTFPRTTRGSLTGVPGNALLPGKVGQLDPVSSSVPGETGLPAASWARDVAALFDSPSGPILENADGIWRISRGVKQLLADRLPPVHSRKAYAFTPDGKHGWAVGNGLYSWDATRSVWVGRATEQLVGRKLMDVSVHGDGEDYQVLAVGNRGTMLACEGDDTSWKALVHDDPGLQIGPDTEFTTIRWSKSGDAWVGGKDLWHVRHDAMERIPLPGADVVGIRSVAPGSHGNVHAVLVNEARLPRGTRQWSGDTLATWNGSGWTQTFLPARTGVGDPQIVQLATAGDLGLAIERGAPGGRLFRYTEQSGWTILEDRLPEAYLDTLVFSDSHDVAYALDISEQRVWRLDVPELRWTLLGERSETVQSLR